MLNRRAVLTGQSIHSQQTAARILETSAILVLIWCDISLKVEAAGLREAMPNVQEFETSEGRTGGLNSFLHTNTDQTES